MIKSKEIFWVSAAFAALSSFLGILAVPVYMLVLLNVTDYITGILAAKYRSEPVNSNKGFRGIVKKVCMLVIVAIGGAVDWLLMFTA
ncbi:MAG: phage holin family protein, partial [Acetanaerobacterium sp.]